MGCKRFIGAGSQAEYGPMDVPRIAPDSPVHPTTPYGASKLAANQLSFMLCKELGMEWIWPVSYTHLSPDRTMGVDLSDR